MFCAGSTLQAVCCQVMSEGGTESGIGYNFAAANVADIATSTSRANVIAIRPKSEFPASSGIVPRGTILPLDISVASGGQTHLVEVFYAPTFSGGTWTSANAASTVEFSVNATTSALGPLVDAFFVSSGGGVVRAVGNDTISSQYPIARNLAGTGAYGLLVTATTVTGTGTARVALTWRELR
jgi:hypothetical protein